LESIKTTEAPGVLLFNPAPSTGVREQLDTVSLGR